MFDNVYSKAIIKTGRKQNHNLKQLLAFSRNCQSKIHIMWFILNIDMNNFRFCGI
jgi:hypothetical protein